MLKYFNFARRATRGEFWTMVIASIVLNLILFALVVNAPILGILWIIGYIALFVAMLATTISRIRDAGHSPLWIVACFIPYFGFIVWFVFGCLQSKKASII